jgi:hypothetical protein
VVSCTPDAIERASFPTDAMTQLIGVITEALQVVDTLMIRVASLELHSLGYIYCKERVKHET